MHCKLRHEGQIQLKPAMCRTVWREHDLPRGGRPQTEFAVLFGANIFMQKRHVGSESGVLFTGPLKKVLGALAPSALLGTVFQIACCEKCRLFWLADKSPMSFCFRQNTPRLACGRCPPKFRTLCLKPLCSRLSALKQNRPHPWAQNALMENLAEIAQRQERTIF